MRWDYYIDWGPLSIVAAIIASALILIFAVLSCLPATVVVRDCGDRTVEKYDMPKGYRYYGSLIEITGNVATVTATFRKEVTK